MKWYQKTWVIIAFLIFFFPVGLFLMWKYTNWDKKVKWSITGLFAFLIIVSLTTPTTEISSTATKSIQPSSQPTSTPTPSQSPTITYKPTSAPKQVSKPTTPPASSVTVSQKNAVRKAKDYLAYTAFSHDGLVDQLVYEQFSPADAVYGADNCGANWNEQAAKKAKAYMDYSSFSRGGLIDQLLYEKFTQEQAEYGANAVGL